MDGQTSPPHIIDAAIVALIVVMGLVGLMRGGDRELRALARLVLAAAAAIVAYPYAEPALAGLLAQNGGGGQPTLSGAITRLVQATSALAPFLAVWAVLGWLPPAPRRRPKGRGGPDMLSRSLGAVLGLMRGAALAVLIYLALSWATAPVGLETWTAQARLPPLLDRAAQLIRPGEAPSRELADDRADRLRDLSVPVPISDAPTDEPSYNRRARDQLDRLIEGTR